MTTSSSYDASTANCDLDSELQRLQAQALLSWEKEARTLTWFGLQNGMSILELGSGPGFITEQLLNLLPNSSLTAVEIDPVLLKRAKQYLRGKASDRLRIIEASVMDNKLPDNSFDFAVARFLFQHLSNPVEVVKEVLRILKPGGKLVIIDTDDDIFGIIDPPIPELPIQLFMEKGRQLQAAQGGNRLIGRRLWRILKAAGFQNLDLEVVTCHSDALGIDAFLPQLNPERLLPLVEIGVISEQELEGARASYKKFLALPNPFMLMLLLMACGEKPQLIEKMGL